MELRTKFLHRRHSGDGNIQRQHRVKAFAEGHLHRAAYLTGVGAGGHHRAKGPHVIEQFAGLFASGIYGVFVLGPLNARLTPRQGDLPVQVHGFLHENAHARLTLVGHFNIVADATLGGHVRDEPLHGLRVNAGHIAHVRVAVGVCVGAGHIIQKFVTVLKCHDLLLLIIVYHRIVILHCRSVLLVQFPQLLQLCVQFSRHLTVSQCKIGLLLQV